VIGTALALALAVYLARFTVLFVLMAQSTRDEWEELLAEEERLRNARRDWWRREA